MNLKTNENHCGECFNRCEAGEQCVRGECQGSCPRPPLTEGECNCAFVCGDTDPSPFVCGDNPNCNCAETTEGTGFCRGPNPFCDQTCTSSDECEALNPGWKCLVNSCCDTPVCQPPCTPTCAQNGSTCRGDIECCSSICESETCVACRSNGSPCTATNNQCCSGNCSAGEEHSFCACQPNGGTCMANDQCCSANCSGTTCACRPTGSVCTDLSQCCTAQCENGKCCIPEGTSAFGFCTTNDDCCGGLDCIDGICIL